MSNRNIALSAINKLNESKAEAVIDRAQALISYIQQEQAKVTKFQKQIGDYQVVLKGMEQEMLTAKDVLNREPSLNPSPAEVTILAAVAKRNEEKAKSQAANSKAHVEAIDSLNGSIKGCENRIAELRKELLALTAEEVTETQILG